MLNKKNILLLTSIYPSENNGGTPVCHYFARDWVKLGYNVIAIHIHPLFPIFYYWAAKILKKKIEARTGNIVDTIRETKTKSFVKEGVKVYRIQIKKNVPHGSFSRKSLEDAKQEIKDLLETENFKPDYICGHFPNPQLELIYYLKSFFPEAVAAYISHGDDLRADIRNIYGECYEKVYRKSIDIFGYRSVPIKKEFELKYGNADNSFICYSGIPEDFVSKKRHYFNESINHFCFLGSLFELKKVDVTLRALAKSFPKKNFCFDIIGGGAEYSNLVNLAKSLGIEKQVKFYGKVQRNIAQDIMAKADCFIMVSSHEAFGLVYLEAMGKGLIPIGTKGQGIDGVIINGENGFLCPSDDVDALSNIINKICSLDSNQRQNISDKAIQTAESLTDIKAAQLYINALESVIKE